MQRLLQALLRLPSFQQAPQKLLKVLADRLLARRLAAFRAELMARQRHLHPERVLPGVVAQASDLHDLRREVGAAARLDLMVREAQECARDENGAGALSAVGVRQRQLHAILILHVNTAGLLARAELVASPECRQRHIQRRAYNIVAGVVVLVEDLEAHELGSIVHRVVHGEVPHRVQVLVHDMRGVPRRPQGHDHKGVRGVGRQEVGVACPQALASLHRDPKDERWVWMPEVGEVHLIREIHVLGIAIRQDNYVRQRVGDRIADYRPQRRQVGEAARAVKLQVQGRRVHEVDLDAAEVWRRWLRRLEDHREHALQLQVGDADVDAPQHQVCLDVGMQFDAESELDLAGVLGGVHVQWAEARGLRAEGELLETSAAFEQDRQCVVDRRLDGVSYNALEMPRDARPQVGNELVEPDHFVRSFEEPHVVLKPGLQLAV
mmetsp:Transcript_115240/g.366337  ORF Transcript_115240/g.366337 Transcript_115240/m.366337 type:complete len:436 (+) Transcript_115240:507-1814(+)